MPDGAQPLHYKSAPRGATVHFKNHRDSRAIEIITDLESYKEEVSTTPEVASFVNKNFVYVTSSSSTVDQIVFKKTLKESSVAAPSPANRLTISLPDGYVLKAGSESIYRNGVLQSQGTSNDYTVSGNVVTFGYDIGSSDSVVANYVMNSSGSSS